jgi:hypothetical protein
LTVAVSHRWRDQHIGRLSALTPRLQAQPQGGADSWLPTASGLFEFTADAVEELTAQRPFQAAGAALLRLAWSPRESLLG